MSNESENLSPRDQALDTLARFVAAVHYRLNRSDLEKCMEESNRYFCRREPDSWCREAASLLISDYQIGEAAQHLANEQQKADRKAAQDAAQKLREVRQYLESLGWTTQNAWRALGMLKDGE